jgi:uncharacterized protein (DUF305 family)
MQHMIGHHAQALAMTALIPDRTSRADMRLLGERITVSQRDEIALMRRWLQARHEPLPIAGATEHQSMPGMPMQEALMPGMLNQAELKSLADATGVAFERMFLGFMIRHHEGAIAMVKELFGSPGAGQEPEAFRFASDVEADQRAEIARMRALLNALPKSPSP